MNTLSDIIEALDDFIDEFGVVEARETRGYRSYQKELIAKATQALAQLKAAKVYSGYISHGHYPDEIFVESDSVIHQHLAVYLKKYKGMNKPIQIIVIEGDNKGENND